MRTSFPIQFVAFGLFALVVVSAATAFAAGITISPSNAGYQSISVTTDDFKPSACAGINLTNLITGTGTIIGTSGNDLILASSSADSIDGLGGDDCILGGGGDDIITGGDGTDICLGGPGNDTFATCEGEIQ